MVLLSVMSATSPSSSHCLNKTNRATAFSRGPAQLAGPRGTFSLHLLIFLLISLKF